MARALRFGLVTVHCMNMSLTPPHKLVFAWPFNQPGFGSLRVHMPHEHKRGRASSERSSLPAVHGIHG